jgi:hypothetical protein
VPVKIFSVELGGIEAVSMRISYSSALNPLLGPSGRFPLYAGVSIVLRVYCGVLLLVLMLVF